MLSAAGRGLLDVVAAAAIAVAVGAATGGLRSGALIAVVVGSTVTLVGVRLADAAHLRRRARAREQALRRAGAALVSAADVPAAHRAVRAAVAAILAGHPHTLLFHADDGPGGRIAVPPAGEPRAPFRSWWAADLPVARPAGRRPVPRPPRRRCGPGRSTLVCPLWVQPLGQARQGGGALVVVGARAALEDTRDVLEVLAGQTALAVDRIHLVDGVGRRDSDRYLHAAARSTSDMMLVIDDDHVIRYASPALNDLLGTQLGPLQTLGDVLAPDDRGFVTRALLGDGDGVIGCVLQCGAGGQVAVEATYRDLRKDRLVPGFVITFRDVTGGRPANEQRPYGHPGDLPAQSNRRSAHHRFRF